MKKLLAIILTLVLILSCTGCQSKTALTLKGFREAMEDADYEVSDFTDFAEEQDFDAEALIAEKGECEIAFFQFEDEDDAIDAYDLIYEVLEEEKSSSHVTVNLPGFNKHEQTSGSEFNYIARIDDTLIWCIADKDDREEVRETMKMLGYD